ncbi:hypothetical protein CRN84_07460 [Budvicia aquatica]|uniref:Uncharacterized protein n=1 Tax=Budvicia aquatica TaxID=82979 RepID=A0A2C6DFV5_9GAMM|nr:hypothetical protein CRN84_07460 [Budvicia aquatica]
MSSAGAGVADRSLCTTTGVVGAPTSGGFGMSATGASVGVDTDTGVVGVTAIETGGAGTTATDVEAGVTGMDCVEPGN